MTIALLLGPLAIGARSQSILLMSVGPQGEQADSSSDATALSGDGEWVAFASTASNLVRGDTNDSSDVFVRHWRTRQTRRISVDSSGAEANGVSLGPAISQDGRFIAFVSDASNLVPGDTNGEWDVFVHDRQLGTTRRVSVDSNGAEGNGSSGFVYPWGDVAMTPDGRTVVFSSDASNLVPGDTNRATDIFIHHLPTGSTTRVSLNSQGIQSNGSSRLPAVSADGQIVAFASRADNLVLDDSNDSWDVFLHDRLAGQTERISVATLTGEQGDRDSGYMNRGQKGISMSADGGMVAFFSVATNLGLAQVSGPKVYLRDRQRGVTRRVARIPADQPAMSPDGRFVAFRESSFWGDAIYIMDLETGTLQRIDKSVLGEPALGSDCGSPSISADGRRVAFYSAAPNLVTDDSSGRDVFLRDRIELSFVGIPQEDSPTHFEIRNVIGEAGHLALVLFSFSGTEGIPLPDGREIPLTFDRWTHLGLTLWPFVSAVIDADGSAATPEIPFPDFPFRYVVSAAAITIDLSTGRIESISNVAEFSMQ